MAIHARERILEAVKSTLTGATAAGANVYRTRVYPHEALPALEVLQGADEVELEDSPYPYWDRRLVVYVDVLIAAVADPVEAILNAIAREVHVALLANVRLGEAAVIDTVPLADDEPEIIEAAERKTARLRMVWRVHYRTGVDDPAT